MGLDAGNLAYYAKLDREKEFKKQQMMQPKTTYDDAKRAFETYPKGATVEVYYKNKDSDERFKTTFGTVVGHKYQSIDCDGQHILDAYYYVEKPFVIVRVKDKYVSIEVQDKNVGPHRNVECDYRGIYSACEVKCLRMKDPDPPEVIKTKILNTVANLAYAFMENHRQNDPDVKPGMIEEAVRDGVLTIDEINYTFAKHVIELIQSRMKKGQDEAI